jgi:hypothetical protein
MTFRYRPFDTSHLLLRSIADLDPMQRIKMVCLLLLKTSPPLRYHSYTMSSFAPDGDAVQLDGTLKDASEITWFYNANESIPFPSGSASASHSSHAPATTVAGVCRTTRIICPSRHYIKEAEVTESASSTSVRKYFGVKRKATSNLPDHRAACKKITDAVDNAAAGDASDNATTTAPPTELTSDDYESLKAMANADNLVCSPRHLIFQSHYNFNLRQRPSSPERSVLLTYASFSAWTKNTSIWSPGRNWLAIGARFVGKYLPLIVPLIFH